MESFGNYRQQHSELKDRLGGLSFLLLSEPLILRTRKFSHPPVKLASNNNGAKLASVMEARLSHSLTSRQPRDRPKIVKLRIMFRWRFWITIISFELLPV